MSLKDLTVGDLPQPGTEMSLNTLRQVVIF